VPTIVLGIDYPDRTICSSRSSRNGLPTDWCFAYLCGYGLEENALNMSRKGARNSQVFVVVVV
jgi:hypothetical protein